MRKIVAIAMILIGLLSIAEPVLACNPPPSSTDCGSLSGGYRAGFGVYNPTNRTYYFTPRYGVLTGGAPVDRDNYVTISNKSGQSFDWSASMGIDAVIVQSGSNSTVTKKSEAKSGHVSTSSRRRIDKVYFCYDYELTVTTSAQGTNQAQASWDVYKWADPEQQMKLAGEKAIFDYTVMVRKFVNKGTMVAHNATALVEIKNNTPLDATITNIYDQLRPGDIGLTLDCGDLKFPYTLPVGETITCTGATKLDWKLDGYNWVKVKTSGSVGGATSTGKITWSTETLPGTTVTITDTDAEFGGPYTIDGDKSWAYSVALSCPADPATYANGPQKIQHDNDVYIVETGQCDCTTVYLSCYQLDVTTTAKGTISGAATWDITKTVDKAEQVKFAGEKATFNYTVAVKKMSESGGEGSGYNVASTVVVTNNTPLDAPISAITDMLKPGDTPVTLDCKDTDGKSITYPYTLPSGKNLTCTGSAPLTSQLDGQNWVKVSTTNELVATGDIVWDTTGASTTTGPSAITVTDNNAAFAATFEGPQTASTDKTWTYSADLPCPVEQAAYKDGPVTLKLDNIATIVETGQAAKQSASVTCYAPTLTTTVSPSYDVDYTWDITKTALPESSKTNRLKLGMAETLKVSYTLTTQVTEAVESNIKLAGAVVVTNPNPDSPLTATLTDEIAAGVFATFTNCTNPLTVAAGESKTCNFELALDTKPAGESKAALVFNELTWNASAAYDFANALKNETHKCITVHDDKYSDTELATVCADQSPKVFNYDLIIGPYFTCGDIGFTNAAWFETLDKPIQDGYASVTTYLKVACTTVTDCVKPEAYWLDRSDSFSMFYDKTWDKITPSGQSSLFYTTGLTWVEMLRTDATGNPYRTLAHAYITAQLNHLFGATFPIDDDPNRNVAAAVTTAEGLLATYASDPSQITDPALISTFNATAQMLVDYNNGLFPPGKCPNCQY